jgi:hypothetical protein
VWWFFFRKLVFWKMDSVIHLSLELSDSNRNGDVHSIPAPVFSTRADPSPTARRNAVSAISGRQ